MDVVTYEARDPQKWMASPWCQSAGEGGVGDVEGDGKPLEPKCWHR